ncbi:MULTISPECIES: hypothetical protein [unclassified Paraflavitalea]|jgi:hypothetical protein|uniref:hypothetical protein n=1 Tax=unclassified Paraflavitalea TaxID=2798305 RepID=UPI003D331543
MKQPEYRREEGSWRTEEILRNCKRCENAAIAAVMKHSKYSVFSLYRKETKYATVRNEKLSEFSAPSALFAVNPKPKA